MTVEFLPFATGVGANVQSQASYEGAASTLSGFQAGIALSSNLNKVWRQSSFVAAAVANFIANSLNADVLDDGDLNSLVTQLTQAIGIAPLDVGAGRALDLDDHNRMLIAVGAARTLTVPQVGGLTKRYNVALFAQEGAITLTPDAADSINGLTVGASYIIPKGWIGFMSTDAADPAGKIYLVVQRASMNYGTIASAATCDIGSLGVDVGQITGNTTITSFGTSLRPGQFMVMRAAGAFTITNNANIEVQGAADFITASGDILLIVCIGDEVVSVSPFPIANSFLPLTGGTMSGAIAMGTNKITGLGDGTNAGDAVNKSQLDLKAPLASPAFTDTPTAPTAAVATDSTQIATTEFVKDAGLGWGQTHQDVTGSRALATAYTNSTGKPILVCVHIVTNTACLFEVDTGGGFVKVAGATTGAVSNSTTLYALVPSGAQYKMTTGGAIQNWTELR